MTRKKQPPEVSIVRSSAAEYLTFVAATGSQEQAVEMRYEDEMGAVGQGDHPRPDAPSCARCAVKAKAKQENLAALGLPALWERFKEATGETTKSPNKKFLVRRIEEASTARAAAPAPAEEDSRPTHTSARATPMPEP